jgi:hypothetical protein
MRTTLLSFLLMIAACDGNAAGVSPEEARFVLPGSSVVHEAQPTLAWTPVNGAESYRVRVYLDQERTVLHEEFVTDDSQAALSVPLPDGARAYAVVQAVALADSTLWTGEVRFRHIAIPDWMPEFRLAMNEEGASDGYTLFNLLANPEGNAIVLVDRNGSPVWWYNHPERPGPADVRVLDNGNLLFTSAAPRDENNVVTDERATEITWDGVEVWNSGPDLLVHHEAGVGPDGHYLLLTWIHEEIDGEVIESDGLEIVDPATGSSVWSWSMFDHFDPATWPTPQLDTNFTGLGADWSHSNGAVWDADRSMIWVSVRHFDAVIGIDYPSGDVSAILGNNGIGGPDLMHRQHAPEIQPDGTMLLWDNGNGRTPPYSRAVQLSFDLDAGTVEEVWEWRATPDLFDFAVGDADRLPNGNTLITAGVSGRIIEVTPAGEIVWDFRMTQGETPPNFPWFYRAEHVPAAKVPDHIKPFPDG